ncbi:putative LIM domain protein, partial [Trichinella spiralis]|uniref:putative LIM domain protein n=1 Tax=Trichinella spiralis TaxID=6334 RepID=UPI0001EFC3D5
RDSRKGYPPQRYYLFVSETLFPQMIRTVLIYKSYINIPLTALSSSADHISEPP